MPTPMSPFACSAFRLVPFVDGPKISWTTREFLTMQWNWMSWRAIKAMPFELYWENEPSEPRCLQYSSEANTLAAATTARDCCRWQNRANWTNCFKNKHRSYANVTITKQNIENRIRADYNISLLDVRMPFEMPQFCIFNSRTVIYIY